MSFFHTTSCCHHEYKFSNHCEYHLSFSITVTINTNFPVTITMRICFPMSNTMLLIISITNYHSHWVLVSEHFLYMWVLHHQDHIYNVFYIVFIIYFTECISLWRLLLRLHHHIIQCYLYLTGFNFHQHPISSAM